MKDQDQELKQIRERLKQSINQLLECTKELSYVMIDEDMEYPCTNKYDIAIFALEKLKQIDEEQEALMEEDTSQTQ